MTGYFSNFPGFPAKAKTRKTPQIFFGFGIERFGSIFNCFSKQKEKKKRQFLKPSASENVITFFLDQGSRKKIIKNIPEKFLIFSRAGFPDFRVFLYEFPNPYISPGIGIKGCISSDLFEGGKHFSGCLKNWPKNEFPSKSSILKKKWHQ